MEHHIKHIRTFYHNQKKLHKKHQPLLLLDATSAPLDGLCPLARADTYPRDEPRAEVLGDTQ